MTTIARLNEIKIHELIKYAQELDHLSVQDVENCKHKLDAISDVEAKGKLFDAMIDEALDCVTIALSKLADDDNYARSIQGPYTTSAEPSESQCVSSILKTIENCKALSKNNNMFGWTICIDFSGYIDKKIASAMSRIMLSRNFGTNRSQEDSLHPSKDSKHHFYPLHVQLQKFQASAITHIRWGGLCHCDQRIQNYEYSTIRITVKYEGRSGEKLTIRGNGPGMSWEKGVELQNLGGDFWVFEIRDDPSIRNNLTPDFEYKILLNDQQWESAANHQLGNRGKQVIRPAFEKV